MQMSNVGDVLSKLAQLKRLTDGSREAKPLAARQFFATFGKQKLF